AGYGVQKYIPWSGWQPLTSVTASSVAINSYGVVLANFNGYGMQLNFPGVASWTSITPFSGQFLALDRDDHAVADFIGYGVNTYQPLGSWTSVVSAVDPTVLAVA